MTFFQKFGQAIAKFLKKLFNAAERAYNDLSPEEQSALVFGSGILHVINNMTDDLPQTVRTEIQLRFPNLDVARLEISLFNVAKAFGLGEFNNLDDCIVALQKYFASLDGKIWAVASHAGASLIAIAFAPAGMRVAAVVSLIEYVYQTFIKKSV